MNAALLEDGARDPARFWIRYAVDRGIGRLRVFGIVLALPLALGAALFWKADLGEKAGNLELFARILGTTAAAALVHLAGGALLDLLCETSRFGAILQREIRFYFHTPVPYMIMVLFMLASGFFFHAIMHEAAVVSYRIPLQTIASFLIFLVPLLTIRAFAEEKSSGTVEPLLTAPVSEAQVVAGKFCGALVFFCVMLLPTLAYFPVLRFIGAAIGKPDGGPVLAGYAGMILFGGFHIAIGIFASTLTQDAVLGAFLAFVMTLFFWVVEPLMQAVNTSWSTAADYLSPTRHLDPFLKGMLPPMDAIYFLSFILFFLFLSVRSIEYRKWR